MMVGLGRVAAAVLVGAGAGGNSGLLGLSYPSLRIASKLAPPYLMQHPNGTYYGFLVDLVSFRIHGFCLGELLWSLEVALLLTTAFPDPLPARHHTFYTVPDREWGFKRNGRWNGVIEQVIRGVGPFVTGESQEGGLRMTECGPGRGPHPHHRGGHGRRRLHRPLPDLRARPSQESPRRPQSPPKTPGEGIQTRARLSGYFANLTESMTILVKKGRFSNSLLAEVVACNFIDRGAGRWGKWA